MNFSSNTHVLLAVYHPRAPEGAAFVMETDRWDPVTVVQLPGPVPPPYPPPPSGRT